MVAVAVTVVALLAPSSAARATVTGGITGPAGMCVDVSGGNSADGTQVQLWPCNGTPAQLWTPQRDGTIRALGKCLTVAGGGTAAGTRVQLWSCNGTRSQRWVQSGGVSLVNPQSEQCLDATGGNTSAGTPLQIWWCNGTAAQGWVLPAGSDVVDNNPSQGYEITYQAPNSRQWYIDPDGTLRQSLSALAPGTSPAIAPLPGGGWESAFVASDGSYWVDNNASGGHQVSTQFTVWPGTSPAISAEVNGRWMSDVQAASSREWTYDSAGNLVQTPSALAAASPSIAEMTDETFEETFVASSGLLWVANSATGGHMLSNGLGVSAGTDPVIAAGFSNNRWEVAFQGGDHHLWTVDEAGNQVQYPYVLEPTSGVAIVSLNTGGYEIVFKAASDGLLYKMAADGSVSLVANGLGMAAHTRPVIALGNTGYEIAFHANGEDTVWFVDPNNIGHDTGQAIAANTSPAIAAMTGSQPAGPGVRPLQVTSHSVTISWNDRSTNEYMFHVQKRLVGDNQNDWEDVYSTFTDDPAGGGEVYSYTDTDTSTSAQCYQVIAVPIGFALAGSSQEQCTVRPDPARFPQVVPLSATQWDGFSRTNGAADGILQNSARSSYTFLIEADQTWGVNLDWYNGFNNFRGCWKFLGQGSGGTVMMGQALAIETCDGQYLRHGGQTFGVDLVLSGTPSYEWYVIGDKGAGDGGGAEPGNDPTSGDSHALWNSDAHAYLVAGDQTFGVNLTWFDPSAPTSNGGLVQPTPAASGVGLLRMYNCSAAGNPVSVWVKDATAGGGFQKIGSLPFQSDPDTGCVAKDSQPLLFMPAAQHSEQVVVTDPLRAGCGTDDPNNSACVVESRTITGNPAGAIETTTVGVGTDRSPIAFNWLNQ